MSTGQPIEPRGEPWPHPWPPEEHCYWHGAHEPVPPEGAYIVCGECGHLYATAADLVNAFLNEAPPELEMPPVAAESIAFCPYCLHDF